MTGENDIYAGMGLPKTEETPPATDANNTETTPAEADADQNQPATAETQPTEPAQPAVQIEITDDVVLNYLKQKNPDVNSIEELFKKPELIKEVVNPYADLEQVEDVKNFLEYVKETGRGMDDYLKLKEDVDSMSALDLARQRVKDELGRNDVTLQQIDKILEKRLNVDLTDITELDETDALEIEAYAKPARDARKADKEKYLKPLEKQPAAPTEEMVTLENGQQVPKAQYVARENYLKAIKTSADSVADVSFKINIGDSTNPFEVTLKHDYLPEDRHSMQSMASDVDSTIKKLFGDGENFNHAQFQEGLWWLDKTNREKFASNIAQQARAQAIDEMLKDEHNVNFKREGMPANNKQKPGYGSFSDIPEQGGLRVKI